MKTYKPSGYILWAGPSEIDGSPIVVIAITRSSNRKTGNMVQTYILRADQSPIDAVRTGADVSICGYCPHRGWNHAATDPRGIVGRTCYVNIGQGPLSVWRAFQRHRYPVAVNLADIGLSRLVRLGTYGDPGAVPSRVWDQLLSRAVGHTGYSHQWRTRPDLSKYVMASVDSRAEADDARAMGFRTFRVNLATNGARVKGEGVCPASAEAGKKLNCDSCLACDGNASNRRGSIVINAHGGTAVMANVRKLQNQTVLTERVAV